MTIPEGVKEIGRGAFEDCASLQSVIIPESVKKIIEPIGDSSLALIALHIPISNFGAANKPCACAGFAKAYLDGWEIDEEIKAGYLKYIKGQKKRLFPLLVQHEELLRVMLAEKMIVRKDIDPLLAECDRQNNVAAKAAVLDYAGRNLEPADPFAEMEKELAKMERQAKRFEKTGQLPASELKKIWSTKKLEDGTLEITSYKGTDTTVSVPAVIGKTAVTAIGEKALSPLASRLTPEQKRVRETLESVTIPAGVTEIGGSAFYGCANLTSVTIPAGVTEIGDSAFDGCANLTSVTIPEGVTEIGFKAFSGCSNLTSVTIPAGVTEIGGRAFDGCANLTSVTIPESGAEIGTRVFRGCTSLQSVTILEGATEIGERAFKCCANLQSVTIPESVKKIGYDAFYGCASLASVTIPESVTEIGVRAFSACTSLTIHASAGSRAEEYAKKYKIPFEAI